MRKYPALLLALLLVFGTTAVLAVRALDAPKDKVTFTETVVYGDPSAADGLTVRLDEQYQRRMHWTSEIDFKDSSYCAHTDYVFEQNSSWDNDERERRSFDLVDDVMSSYDFDNENDSLSAEIEALTERAQPGTTASAILRVADYYETYPMSLYIVLPGMFWGTGAFYTTDAERETVETITDYFQIPMLDDQYLQVEVGKSINGGSSTGISSTEQGDSFSMYAQAVATDEAFYFFFSNRTYRGALVDTSRIPGGYGIYRLPYGRVDTDAPYKGQPDGWHGYDVFADQLSCIFPVDPTAELSHLAASEDGTKLFLHTIEDGVYCLYLLDADSGAELQRIEVSPVGDEWTERVDGAGFQFIRLDDEFFVYALSENGRLELVLDVQLTDLEKQDDYLPWYSSQNRTMTLQDGKLAIVCNAQNVLPVDGWERSVTGCGFSVSVYEDGALQYYGLYGSSLDAANSPESARGEGIEPTWRIPIQAAWS